MEFPKKWLEFPLQDIKPEKMNSKSINLRWGVDEVSEKGQFLKDLVRDELDIAVPQAPQEIERHQVHVDQG